MNTYYANPDVTTATIEIVHDADGPIFDTATIIESIQMVSAITGRLDIVSQNRRMPISSGEENIPYDEVHWPKPSTDIGLLITGRKLQRDNLEPSKTLVGVSAQAYMPGTGWVIVLAGASERFATCHELGHIFQPPDNNPHCEDKDCIMYPSFTSRERLVPTKRGAWRALLEAGGLAKPQYETEIIAEPPLGFCGDCAEIIHAQAIKKAVAGMGIRLP